MFLRCRIGFGHWRLRRRRLKQSIRIFFFVKHPSRYVTLHVQHPPDIDSQLTLPNWFEFHALFRDRTLSRNPSK
jgi:hypothetical protein